MFILFFFLSYFRVSFMTINEYRRIFILDKELLVHRIFFCRKGHHTHKKKKGKKKKVYSNLVNSVTRTLLFELLFLKGSVRCLVAIIVEVGVIE